MIADDSELLGSMIREVEHAPNNYRPGPYWSTKTGRATSELLRHGLANFRGPESAVATSYGDNPLIDIRSSYRSSGLNVLKRTLTGVPLFSHILQSQVNHSERLFRQMLVFKNEYLRSLPRVASLLSKYPIAAMDTTKGACVTALDFDEIQISHYYLELLDTLDLVMNDLGRSTLVGHSVLEIGGGFGGNAHLMVELLGARKVIYLDIAPNLYVGTQYLRSFYGDSVLDFRAFLDRPVCFKDDDSLQIFCVLPHQIEQIESPIDLFHNAHSFVEMPEPVVRNYVSWIEQCLTPETGTASLVTYDGYDPSTTFSPEILGTLFGGRCESSVVETLTPGRRNFHFCYKVK